MALEAIQQKKQFIESRARIREFVFGIQDGLISTVGLLAGIQGATENTLVVIIADSRYVFGIDFDDRDSFCRGYGEGDVD